MDTTTQVQISSISTRQANGSNGPFTVYEVIDSNNVRWRAKKNIFDEAALLVGQTVNFVGFSKQNGTYTNYYVNAIVGGVAPAAPAPAQAAPAPVVNDAEERKNLSIHRQVAAKVSALISQSPDEFWGNVTDLVNFFQTGQTPTTRAAQQAAQEAAQAPAQTTQYPAPDTGVDDDIPF